MLRDVKDITTENPDREVWRFLRFFLDEPHTIERIQELHPLAGSEQRGNLRKQAQQIGYCIRQAEEYFQASAETGLATRPTLLYYGAASLARALTLLRQDGSHSFDALRKADKHNHHGLDLCRGDLNVIRPDDRPEAFLSHLSATCHTNRGLAWGTFALFYQSLTPCACKIRLEIREEGQSLALRTNVAQPCADLLAYDSLIGQKHNSLYLMKTLPDMYFPLLETGIRPALCRGSIDSRSIRIVSKDSQNEKRVSQVRVDHRFFLDDISPEDKSRLLSLYQKRNPRIKTVADLGTNVMLEVATYNTVPPSTSTDYIPDMVDDLTGRIFFILEPYTYLPEPASQFVLLFCLGMLSRYYPDIWMSSIQKNVQLSELLDSLLGVIARKFPNLVLDQMTDVKHHFNTG